MEVSPALPWDETTEGGTIKLTPAITENELQNDYLKIEAQDTNDKKFYCLFDMQDEYLRAGNPSEEEIADVYFQRENNKIIQINIGLYSIYEIISITKNTEEISLLPEKDLPITGNLYISCSKGISFDEVLTHVKLKFAGDSDFVAAQQRDQYACEWVSSSNNAIRFGCSRDNNDPKHSIMLRTSTSATLAAIKYEP